MFVSRRVMFCDRAVTLCGLIIHRYHRRLLQAEAMIILGVSPYRSIYGAGLAGIFLRPLVRSVFSSGKTPSLDLWI